MTDGFIVMTPIGGEIRSLSQDSDLKHGAEQPIRQAGNADTIHISMAMLRQVTDAEHESACKRLKAERSGGQGLADGGGDAAAAMRRIGKWFALFG